MALKKTMMLTLLFMPLHLLPCLLILSYSSFDSFLFRPALTPYSLTLRPQHMTNTYAHITHILSSSDIRPELDLTGQGTGILRPRAMKSYDYN